LMLNSSLLSTVNTYWDCCIKIHFFSTELNPITFTLTQLFLFLLSSISRRGHVIILRNFFLYFF
jgi:hypothetical protein